LQGLSCSTCHSAPAEEIAAVLPFQGSVR
jgi:hypothetical protein